MLAVVFLSGCSSDGLMEETLTMRSTLLGAQECNFTCSIIADYSDSLEQFVLDCQGRQDGTLLFSVAEPESIRGITGAVDADEGAMTFDDEILAFPLMADDRISPISAPWILVNTLKSGYITAVVREDDLLHLSINDTYADDALELEVWLNEIGTPINAEISWKGIRMVSMEIENWTIR